MKDFMKKNIFFVAMLLILNLFIGQFILSAEETPAYSSKNKRDPFVPLVTESGVYAPGLEMSVESVADISLEGTMFDPGGKSVAIINGQILSTGDQIGIFKIIKIDASGVVISSGEREYTVTLNPE